MVTHKIGLFSVVGVLTCGIIQQGGCIAWYNVFSTSASRDAWLHLNDMHVYIMYEVTTVKHNVPPNNVMSHFSKWQHPRVSRRSSLFCKTLGTCHIALLCKPVVGFAFELASMIKMRRPSIMSTQVVLSLLLVEPCNQQQ